MILAFFLLGYSAAGIAVHVNLIEIIPSDHPFIGYKGMAPILDVSYKYITDLYPAALANLTRQMIVEPGEFRCPDPAVEMDRLLPMLPKLWNQLAVDDRLNVVITSGKSCRFCFQRLLINAMPWISACTYGTMVLGDFARGIPMLH